MNIAIINYCNLKCPYCFADDMIQEESKCLSVDDFKKILDFACRTPRNYIGIIGGEPTLHPQFKEILAEVNKYCKQFDTGATLFTNGINLEPYLADISERIGILINCNSPKYMGAEKFSKQRKVLDHLDMLSWFDSRVTIGYNLFIGDDDRSFIWDIVDRYHINHVRTSVSAPGGIYIDWRNRKEEYYQTMKPKFLEFCREAIEHHCILNVDCNHIPDCYFDDNEMELIMQACGPEHEGICEKFCNPVIDITPDFKATACFGSYDPVDIRDFNCIDDLERHLLLKKSYIRALANNQGKCSTCKLHENMQCQGGCLGFADMKVVDRINSCINKCTGR